MPRKTRKRKLAIKNITKCNPASASASASKSNTTHCLPKNIYSAISKKLKIKNEDDDVYKALQCNTGEEHCLLDKAPLNDDTKKQLRKDYLRPRRPKQWDEDPDMWLDNYNIMAVMKQYEQAYPWFRFLGVFPIDFSAPDPYQRNGSNQCLYRETCNLDLKKEYDRRIRGIGMVFNLDPHFKGGSHWVALYIDIHDISKPFVGYFDSYGYKTPPLIARLMRSFKLQIKSCDLGFNARRFQYGNSECGMFSMYFLICMIHGISFRDFCKDSVNDKYMLELRKALFTK